MALRIPIPDSKFIEDTSKLQSLNQINENSSTTRTSLHTSRQVRNKLLPMSVNFMRRQFSSPKIVVATHSLLEPSKENIKPSAKPEKKVSKTVRKSRKISRNLLLDRLGFN